MPQKTYSIYNSESIQGDQQLAVEIGKNYLALVLGTSSKLSGFEYYDAEENDLQEFLIYIKSHSQLLDKSYSETHLYYNLEESVLVPIGQFNTSVASEFVDLAFGNKPASRINVENVDVQPGVVNVYRSNEQWPDVINEYFRAVTKRHLFSRLIETAANDSVHVQFCKKEMIVIANGNKQLQLARSFDYLSNEDALYHLLNAFKQTRIDPAQTHIVVAGFIDESSALATMLHQYFASMSFDNTVAKNILPQDALSKYPSHYFTSFFKLLS
jgi:hypothetical protein